MESGEFVALLATLMLPVALPATEGENIAASTVVWPGDRISPVETPLALNPAPETVTPEIATWELPAFVSVTFWMLLLERFTFPKFTELVLELRRRVAAFTVRIAALLVAAPALSLATALNCALLSEMLSGGVVYVEEVAPLITAPFFLH
jgi:hypothetical protein